MNSAGIKNINIKLNSNEIIIATPKMFENLYISNLNESGDEIAFISNEKNNHLKANFFMIKLSNEIIEYNLTNNSLKENAFKLLREKKIKEVEINFKNGYSQPFTFNINKEIFSQKRNNDLCLLLSEHNIKYKNNLFA